MKQWLFCIILILTIALIVALNQVRYSNQKWENAMVNVKAYSEELNAERDKSTAYKLTIDQLEYFQDSIITALNTTREELKIKNKNLKALQYISSSFSRTDTLVLKDTIFKETSFSLDTVIGDRWYKVQLGLKYPSEISINPEFTSEKHLIVSMRKETVNPPKKFFLARWFQKRHKVLQVDVVEKNPYMDNQTSKYIEILK